MHQKVIGTRRGIVLGLLLATQALGSQAVDDGLLYDRVHRKLNNDRSLRIRDLKVEVSNGVVTIEGIVRSAKLRGRAAKVASIKGVKQVINRLVIGN